MGCSIAPWPELGGPADTSMASRLPCWQSRQGPRAPAGRCGHAPLCRRGPRPGQAGAAKLRSPSCCGSGGDRERLVGARRATQSEAVCGLGRGRPRRWSRPGVPSFWNTSLANDSRTDVGRGDGRAFGEPAR